MSELKPIQLGLCCLNTILRSQKPPVFCSRKMIIRTVKEKGIDVLKSKIIENLNDVIKMIEWNEKHGIRVLRLSSELFPHKSNPKVDDYSFDFAIEAMKKIGEKAREYGHRLTFHPGQYNVVGTPTDACFQQTINDLSYHADVLDYMEMDNTSVMVVHGGGIYGDKAKTIERWKKQYMLLPDNVRKRLVLENCEKCFSIEDCLEVSKSINIPIVFDTHHFECYKILHPNEKFKEPCEYMSDILESWKRRGIKPKFHVSEQGSGKTGHHSDFIEELPEYLLDIPNKYGVDIDVMIEAKMKEQAIFKLYEKYPFLDCKKNQESIVMSIPSKEFIFTFCKNECACCERKVLHHVPTKKKSVKLKIVDAL